MTNIGWVAFGNTAYYNNEDNWENGVLYIGNHLIEVNSEIVKGDYVIRTGTKRISDSTFYGCTSLTSITIPGSVTSIESPAFQGCTGLTAIIVNEKTRIIVLLTEYSILKTSHN